MTIIVVSVPTVGSESETMLKVVSVLSGSVPVVILVYSIECLDGDVAVLSDTDGTVTVEELSVDPVGTVAEV